MSMRGMNGSLTQLKYRLDWRMNRCRRSYPAEELHQVIAVHDCTACEAHTILRSRTQLRENSHAPNS
jgi:hypothetical protein